VPNEVNSLIYIAEHQQYFAANGLKVSSKNYTSGLAAVNGLMNGEVDIATASEFVLVGKALANASICTFGAVSKALNEYVVARTDKGIHNIPDLKDKRIGVSLGTSTEFYLGRFLELNGMHLNQVNIVDVPPPQTPNALANGTVDAVIAWQPNINAIETMLGDKIVMWPAQANQPYYVGAISTNSWTAMHPELIIRFLNALVRAETFSLNNKDKAIAIVAGTLGYDSSYAATVWREIQFSVSIEQSEVLAMEDETRWLINNNLTNATAVPNFLNYVYVDGLETVKPNSVNIIK
jgi:NitT/TauT family transport system substrate-binding protein